MRCRQRQWDRKGLTVEFLIVILVFYVGAVLITRALRRRSGVPTEPQPPQPATDKQRAYLSALQREKPGAAICYRAWELLTCGMRRSLERASAAIERIKRSVT